jgi:hypothetical protein
MMNNNPDRQHEELDPLVRIAIRIIFLAILSAILPALPGQAVETGSSPDTFLGTIWRWLGNNKDQIAALTAIVAAISVFIAALVYQSAQKLNRANAVYQAMKEARDLRLKQVPFKTLSERADPIAVGINFYASIDQYRLSRLIDANTWKNFDKDLEDLVNSDAIVSWLAGKPGAPDTLPSPDKFDPRFIEHLRELQQRPNRKGTSG